MASKSSMLVDEYANERICPVHLGNIHERRTAATLVRAFPMVTFVVIGILAAASAFYHWTRLLLLMCTLFNLSISLGLTQSGVQCILGMRKLCQSLKEEEKAEGAPENAEVEDSFRDAPCNTVHLVIIPSYKEDEALLSQTMEAIAQAEGAKHFRVALAMEAREGPDGEKKGDSLKEKFGPRFARVDVTRHPTHLEEVHVDGSSNPEVPSKGSNVKWALKQLFDQCIKDGLASDNVLLTVADADVIIHPKYFDQIGREFEALREAPGDQHVWTLWQAPQLPFRNYTSAPVVSRLHSCITSVYEFGGVAGLLFPFGADHMVFSTYSLPAQLATKARVFEGDVIAEDHHCHMRCCFYAIRAALLTARAKSLCDGSVSSDSSTSESSDDAQPIEGSGQAPTLVLRPVMLPLKSTAVVSDEGIIQTWKDRWTQAYRHAQGLAELSYALLATWDVLRHLPMNCTVSCKALYKAFRLVSKMLWIHLVPAGQFLCMVVLLFEMTFVGTVRPMCRSGLLGHSLCALAGVWLPMWPIALPMMLIIVSNMLFVPASFKYPAQGGRDGAVWKSEDGGLARWPTVAFCALVIVDLLVFGGPLFLIYGVLATIFAYWNVMLYGNQFKYITATKGMEQMKAAREAESALLDTKA